MFGSWVTCNHGHSCRGTSSHYLRAFVEIHCSDTESLCLTGHKANSANCVVVLVRLPPFPPEHSSIPNLRRVSVLHFTNISSLFLSERQTFQHLRNLTLLTPLPPSPRPNVRGALSISATALLYQHTSTPTGCVSQTNTVVRCTGSCHGCSSVFVSHSSPSQQPAREDTFHV